MPVMPDTRIALSGLSGGADDRETSPFQTLGAMMQIKENQQQYQKRQRELDDDNATRDALQSYQRPEEAIDHLWKTGRSDAAGKLAKHVYDDRNQQIESQNKQLTNTKDRLEQAAQILGSAKDNASYQTVRPSVLNLVQPIFGQSVNDMLPTEYGDGTKVNQLVTAGTTRALQISQSQKVLDDLGKAYEQGLLPASEVQKQDPSYKGYPEWSPNGLKAQQTYRELLGRSLTTATSADDWNNVMKLAYDHGVPQNVIQEFGEWDANAPTRARDLSLTTEQRVNAENQKAAREAADDRADRQDKRDAESDRRWQETDRDRHERERDKPAGGLTQSQKYNEQDALEKENAETETWAQGQYIAASATRPDKTKSADAQLPGGYERLSPTDRAEYIKRRVATQDKKRIRLQGLPAIGDAAKAAIAKKDTAGYEKLEKEYHDITQGLGSLADIAPWNDRATPDGQAQRRKDLAAIGAKLKDPTLSPAARKSLELQYKQLLPGM